MKERYAKRLFLLVLSIIRHLEGKLKCFQHFLLMALTTYLISWCWLRFIPKWKWMKTRTGAKHATNTFVVRSAWKKQQRITSIVKCYIMSTADDCTKTILLIIIPLLLMINVYLLLKCRRLAVVYGAMRQ